MSEDLLENLEYLDSKIDEMGCLRANLEIIAKALEGCPTTDTAGYAVESCAKTFRRLWCDMNNLLVDMIDREKELREAESTLEK